MRCSRVSGAVFILISTVRTFFSLALFFQQVLNAQASIRGFLRRQSLVACGTGIRNRCSNRRRRPRVSSQANVGAIVSSMVRRNVVRQASSVSSLKHLSDKVQLKREGRQKAGHAATTVQ